MARNVFEGCCAVRSRDHGACWPDQSHTYQSIMKLLSIERLSNNSQLQGGNVSKLAMSFHNIWDMLLEAVSSQSVKSLH